MYGYLHNGGASRIISPMHTERLSDDVYVFTSELYYQVTASLIVSGTIGVLIDTLPFPEETVQIAQLVNRLCPDGVRYIVYTQHQADHVYGAAFFPRAEVISHTLCRDLMIAHGFDALEQAKLQSPSLNLVRLRLPTITFDKGSFALRLPGKTLELLRMPGHTPDSIAVLFQEEKLLFAGDTIMALPTVSDPGADVAAIRQAIELVAGMQLDCIVQGHGEIILRGEIKENMRRANHYLEQLVAKVEKLVETGAPREEAARLPIEQCGMPRVLLNGAVTQLHTANVLALYDRMMLARPPVKAVETPKTLPPARTVKPAAKVPTAAAKGEARKNGATGAGAAKSTAGKTKPTRTTASKPEAAKSKPSATPKSHNGKPAAKPAVRVKTPGKAK
jgi:glyoxylase-like metal-dependent hydrolase (beta-lactamase superfamily II)